MINILTYILLSIAFISSILAWLNTEKISRDLKDIKVNLGINEEKQPSFYDNDLDRN